MPAKGQITSLVGLTFGRLVVVALAFRRTRASFWTCTCVCGNEARIAGSALKGGRTQSCGCLRSEMTAMKSRRHGHGAKGRRSPEYESWKAMRTRCTSKTRKDSKYYALRGIRMCERWDSFEAFLADMGNRPDGTTLDRIDTNGNYEPGNCRWATWIEQASNRRKYPKNRAPRMQLNARGEG